LCDRETCFEWEMLLVDIVDKEQEKELKLCWPGFLEGYILNNPK